MPSHPHSMRQRLNARNLSFSEPSPKSSSRPDRSLSCPHFHSVYDAWLTSRTVASSNDTFLVPGAHRSVNRINMLSAYTILKLCTLDLARTLWSLHPTRTTLMIASNFLRSLSPAFSGYSQALVIDEIQSSVISGHFTWSRLTRVITTDIFRRILECLLDSIAISNENFVRASARTFVEYKQLEHRLRLDLPTLEDPITRDLLQESDIFARSFHGMGGFGLLSPFDVVNILTLSSELASHLLILFSLTRTIHFGPLLLSVLSILLPLLLRRFGFTQYHPEAPFSRREVRAAERLEKLRSLAYSDEHRPEIIFFGLGPWILRSWAIARNISISSERRAANISIPHSLLTHINVSDIMFTLQNIPLVLILRSSSASLGSLTLYRSSLHACLFAVQNLINTTRMAYQGIYLMGAFCAASEIQPRLQPTGDATLGYQPSSAGMAVEASNLSYTYPGSTTPSLKNINFKLEAGETLAIVGYNGSGKTTLAKILLRILDFDAGALKINGVDIRDLDVADYHHRVTAVFQEFSKFNSTLRENVGIGYVEKLGSKSAVENSLRLAGAQAVVDSLPHGLRTKLGPIWSDSLSYGSSENCGADSGGQYYGLSGGEWQRIAISRAFMRAEQAHVELLLFDEPTSSLDAHAQSSVFDTIGKISRSPQGERTKTVIFITHRLSTARRADKVAMMENGTITEFGSHEDLLKQGRSYAELYHASI